MRFLKLGFILGLTYAFYSLTVYFLWKHQQDFLNSLLLVNTMDLSKPFFFVLPGIKKTTPLLAAWPAPLLWIILGTAQWFLFGVFVRVSLYLARRQTQPPR